MAAMTTDLILPKGRWHEASGYCHGKGGQEVNMEERMAAMSFGTDEKHISFGFIGGMTVT